MQNTEKTGIKPERINNLIISAMKQSLKATKTILNEPSSFREFIAANTEGRKMIAHCDKNLARHNIAEKYSKGEDALILIGPEGDFSREEIEYAVGMGYMPVHLGTSRLRTETAGISACHSIYFINQ